MISHANRTVALPIPPLPTPVSLAPPLALLISPVGVAPMLAPNRIAASLTAITLATIATDTDREERSALDIRADLQAQDRFLVWDRTAHTGIMLHR